MNEEQKQHLDDLCQELVSRVRELEVGGKVAAMKMMMDCLTSLQKDILCDLLLRNNNNFLHVNQMSEGPLGLLLVQSNKPNVSQNMEHCGSSSQRRPANKTVGHSSPHSDDDANIQAESSTDNETPSRVDLRTLVVAKKPKIGPKSYKAKVLKRASMDAQQEVSKKNGGEIRSEDSQSDKDHVRRSRSKTKESESCDYATRSAKRRRISADESKETKQSVSQENKKETNEISASENGGILTEDGDCEENKVCGSATTDSQNVEKREEKVSVGEMGLLKKLVLDGFALIGTGLTNHGVYRCNKCDRVLKGKFGALEHAVQHDFPDGYLICNDCSYRVKYKSSARSHLKAYPWHRITDLSTKTVIKTRHMQRSLCANAKQKILKNAKRRLKDAEKKQSAIKQDKSVTNKDSLVKKPSLEAGSIAGWHSCPIDICNAVFKKTMYLKEHAKQHRAKDGRYLRCQHCNKCFRWRDSITRHLRTHHRIMRYNAARDWSEIQSDDPAIITGSQNWPSSTTGIGRCSKFSVNRPKQTQQKTKTVGKKSLLKGHVKQKVTKTESNIKSLLKGHVKQKVKKTESTIKDNSKKGFECLRCLRTFHVKRLLLKHLQTNHDVSASKENVDWMHESSTDPLKTADDVNIEAMMPMLGLADEAVNENAVHENAVLVSSSSVYIDNAESPNTGEDIAAQPGGQGSGDEPLPLGAYENHPLEPIALLSPKVECVTKMECVTDADEKEDENMLEGRNCRTHCFFQMKAIQCALCSEEFKWKSSLRRHVETCHPNE